MTKTCVHGIRPLKNCESCFKEREREHTRVWRAKNPEKVREYRKKWNKNYQKNHPEVHRKAQEKYRKNHPEIEKAQNLAYNHIPLQPFCESCGSDQNLQRHHPDYTKPLIVRTLCKTCHNLIHSLIETEPI